MLFNINTQNGSSSHQLLHHSTINDCQMGQLVAEWLGHKVGSEVEDHFRAGIIGAHDRVHAGLGIARPEQDGLA